MYGQWNPAVADDQDRVDGGKAEHTAAGWAGGDHEQAVIAAGAEPAHGAHGVTAKPVGHQPLALGGGIEISAELPPKSHGVSVRVWPHLGVRGEHKGT